MILNPDIWWFLILQLLLELTETSKRHLVTIIRIIQIVLKIIIIRIRKDLYQTIQSIDMISNNFVQ